MSDSGSKRPQHKMAFIHGTGRLDARRADGADYVADKAGGSMPCAASQGSGKQVQASANATIQNDDR